MSEQNTESSRRFVVLGGDELEAIYVDTYVVAPVRIRDAEGQEAWTLAVVCNRDSDVPDEAGAVPATPLAVILDSLTALQVARDLLDTFVSGPPKPDEIPGDEAGS